MNNTNPSFPLQIMEHINKEIKRLKNMDVPVIDEENPWSCIDQLIYDADKDEIYFKCQDVE